MGADLYIKDMDRKNQCTGFEVSRRAVEVGYFRDCYNNWGLFGFLRSNLKEEFSWWQFSYRKKWFGRNKEMKMEGVSAFKAIILKAKKSLSRKTEFYINIFNSKESTLHKVVYNKKKLTKKEIKEFMDHLNLLIKFLDLAIKIKSRIIWSV